MLVIAPCCCRTCPNHASLLHKTSRSAHGVSRCVSSSISRSLRVLACTLCIPRHLYLGASRARALHREGRRAARTAMSTRTWRREHGSTGYPTSTSKIPIIPFYRSCVRFEIALCVMATGQWPWQSLFFFFLWPRVLAILDFMSCHGWWAHRSGALVELKTRSMTFVPEPGDGVPRVP